MNIHVGIDISKSTFDAVTLSDGRSHHRKFDNDDNGFSCFRSWLDSFGSSQPQLIMEATGRYYERFADFCIKQQWPTYVVHPALLKNYTRSRSTSAHKTDAQDARRLADYLKRHEDVVAKWAWSPPSRERRRLKELNRRLKTLENLLIEEKNRQGHQVDLESPVRDSSQRMIDFIEKEIRMVNDEMDSLINQDEELSNEVERLQEIPCVGRKLALTFLSETGTWQKFKTAKGVTAWAGLVPLKHQSGTSVQRQARVSRAGNRRVRQIAYMAAVTAMRKNSAWKPWVDKRSQSKTGKKLLIAIMDKILRVMWGVLKTGTPFNLKTALNA